jgi:uncharacterized protein (TIGR00369 family)
MSGMNVNEADVWFREHFPSFGQSMKLESLGGGKATIRYFAADGLLRPEGTVAGPTMMLIADTAVFAAILSADCEATGAVTSNLNISFLKRPPAKDLLADAELLSLGTRLIVGEVRIHSDGDDQPVAHAMVTYARR